MKKRFRIARLLFISVLSMEMLCRYVDQCRNADTITERALAERVRRKHCVTQ